MSGNLPILRDSPLCSVAGANPRSTQSGKCTSTASSQGALVYQDTQKTTCDLQKIQNGNQQSPAEDIKIFIRTSYLAYFITCTLTPFIIQCEITADAACFEES
jgi:hypothetical protein